MEKENFFKCVQNPQNYTLRDKLDIQSDKSKYPYCSVLQALDLMSDKAVNIYNWKERFYQKVLMYLSDNDLLDELLLNVKKTELQTPEDVKLKQQIEKEKKKELGDIEDEDFDVIEAINSYQDVLSFKTAPKSVIIEKFLESEGNKNQKNPSNEALSIDELGKKSISEKVKDIHIFYIFFIFTFSLLAVAMQQKKNHRPTANNGFHSLYYICTHITLSRHCSILAMNATTNSYVPAVSY